ncbi:nuclear factor 7, ovary-like [Rana temporaria]|uniref:nuclear factor 7, ovary-like n=1 Tax=Rana temporaria TaxID=8407 RepID=UPI001AAC86F2|nr:nuclear factor 7, ovary-like [Rana temporaria]XP_040203085.1 nuclear factor 7, ovary-like [Rana temporaria]
MTSVDLKAELECSVCQKMYTNPVMLRCGHNFCRNCIDRLLDTQQSGSYSCPECKNKTFKSRPALQRNRKLHNIVEKFRSSKLARKKSGDLHKVKKLNEASGKKKKKMGDDLQKLRAKIEKMEEQAQSLKEHRRNVEEKATGDTKRVKDVFKDIRRWLEDLEKRVVREISGKASQVTLSVLDRIQKLEKIKEELSKKIRQIEKLCNMTDPLTVLQESDTGDLCDTEDGDNEDRERHEKLLHDGGGLDMTRILTEVNITFYIQGAADILLDGNTAHNELQISGDRKTVSWSEIKLNHPKTPQRFTDYLLVLSSQSFKSGQHYWDVDVKESNWWRVGMCYPSIDRKVLQAGLGMTNKSWGLIRSISKYSVRHDSKETPLSTNLSSNRVRIYLDYEAGRISFYDLCDPIQHLHTFTTTFTEPLHAGLCVWRGCIKICGGES